MTFEINGVHIYSLTSYYFIVKTDDVDTLTAATNTDLLHQLSDKVDPALLDAVSCVSETISSGAIA